MRFYLLTVFILSTVSLSSQTTKEAYVLYDMSGVRADYQKMIEDLASNDIVFIGEYHNNPISHWLEYEITASLFKKMNGAITLGAEMFESDTQLILNEFLQGETSAKRFLDDCRLWPNYSTDYEPLVSFAKDSLLKFIATNVPRRYADLLHQEGNESVLQTLSDEAKLLIAPLPIPFKADSIMASQGSVMSMMSKNPLALAKAQALKDATMAYFINKNFEKNHVFIHYNGCYHSDWHDGIVYFLKLYNPSLKIKTITTVQQEDIQLLDDNFKNSADYIICVPITMTRTY